MALGVALVAIAVVLSWPTRALANALQLLGIGLTGGPRHYLLELSAGAIVAGAYLHARRSHPSDRRDSHVCALLAVPVLLQSTAAR